MNFQSCKSLRLLFVLSGTLLISACDNDNDAPPTPPPATASFDVTVSNLTNAQPLSPLAVIAHQSGYAVFSVGSAATAGLEVLAEDGDNADLLAEADADPMVVVATAGAAMPIGPAATETVTIEMLESELPDLLLSVSTMLVNTNDAFTGLNGLAIGAMAVGDVLTRTGVAYDAGTEADTEEAAHIPGPAGGGEGLNTARDDQADVVSMHSGVISQDDGFASSDLTEQHRFDNPVVRIRVERLD